MALTIYIIFLIFAVGARIIMQYRMTDDHGIRSIKSTSSKTAIFSSVLLAMSFITILILTCLDWLGITRPQINLDIYGNIIGVIFCAIGISITIFSQYQMGEGWRIGVDKSEKTQLVTQGIYSHVRNPIYSGVMLFAIGLLILIPHLYMLLSLGVGYISIEVHVRYVEEPHLYALHGTSYTDYANQVNR